MARFELRFKKSVAKDLQGLPKTDVLHILKRIQSLRDDSRPPGSKKLAGHALYRIRQGHWRVVYAIDDAAIVIEVIRVAHRGEAYRGL